jgi:hypothetical protein
MDEARDPRATSAFSPRIAWRRWTRAPTRRRGREIRQENRAVGNVARAGDEDVLALRAGHALPLATAKRRQPRRVIGGPGNGLGPCDGRIHGNGMPLQAVNAELQ